MSVFAPEGEHRHVFSDRFQVRCLMFEKQNGQRESGQRHPVV